MALFGGTPTRTPGSIYGGYPTGQVGQFGGISPGRPPDQATAPGGFVADPTGNWYQTPQTKGKNAGEALKALQDASGLNLLGSYNSLGADGTGIGSAAHVAPPDMTAAREAAFNRAKDKAGQTSRGAIDALRNEMAGRGLLGSGIEGGRTADIVAQTAGGVQDVSREQAIQDAANASQWGAMQYQGDITQRGQDLSAQQAERARQAQALQGLLSVINSGPILY